MQHKTMHIKQEGRTNVDINICNINNEPDKVPKIPSHIDEKKEQKGEKQQCQLEVQITKKVIGRACPGHISDEGMSGENNENDDQVQ